MSEAGVGTTAGIEIPGTRDDYQETDRSVASDGFESGGLATPPNTPISTSLTPNNSLLLSKSWFAEQFHRQMMTHHTHAGFTESTERIYQSTGSHQPPDKSSGLVKGGKDKDSPS